MYMLRIAGLLLVSNILLAQAPPERPSIHSNLDPISHYSQDPIVYFSLTESLESLAPLEGANVHPGQVWFKVEPGTRWEERGIRHISSWCCKDVSTGEGGGPRQTVNAPGPYIYDRDLTGHEEGSIREFYMDAHFTNGTYESDTTNFAIATDKSYQLTTENCKISWAPSPDEDNPEVDVVGYKVNLMTMDPYSVSVTNVGMDKEAACDRINARPGRNTATVEAYNEHGPSKDPPVIRWMIVTEAPQPPSNVRHEGQTMEECKISWDPSPDESFGKVSGYMTTVAQSQDFSGAMNKNVGLVNSALCNSIGAKFGNNYVKVRAHNPAGASEYTEPLEFVIGNGETPPPCPPCNLCEICKKECPND